MESGRKVIIKIFNVNKLQTKALKVSHSIIYILRSVENLKK